MDMDTMDEYIEAGYPIDGVQLVRVDNDVVNNDMVASNTPTSRNGLSVR